MNQMLSLPKPYIKYNSSMYRERFIWENNTYNEWFALILQSGRFEFTMNGKKSFASDGDVIIFPPDVPFSRHIIKPITLLYINFGWDGNLSDSLWQDYAPCGKLDFIDATRVKEDIRVLFTLCNLSSRDALALSGHYFCDIWFDYCKLRATDSIIDYSKIDDAVISQAVKLISQSFASPLRISELAAGFGMSHVNFTNRFIRATGMPPVSYLQRTRLNNARMLLTGADMPVNEIARQCGFENQFYFSRCFRSEYGMPPTEYRAISQI